MKAVVLLAAAGAVFALGLGFAGYSIARDTIALPAVALEGGKPLAPAAARRAGGAARADRTPTATGTVATTTRGDDGRGGTTTDDDRGGTTTDGDSSGTSGRGGSRSGDDDGDGGRGRGRNRGRGADD